MIYIRMIHAYIKDVYFIVNLNEQRRFYAICYQDILRINAKFLLLINKFGFIFSIEIFI